MGNQDQAKTYAERSTETIGKLVAAARGLFGERGFEAVTVDDIVAEAGMSKGAFYHHFGSKDDILEHVVDEILKERPELEEYRQRITDPDIKILIESVLVTIP